MDQILSEFKTTIVYSKFVSDPKLIALFVGGSHQLGVADEQSDYDLMAIYTEKPTDSMLTHGHCIWRDGDTEVCIHWYLDTLETLFCNGLETKAKRLFFAGRIAAAEKLYVNPRFGPLVDAIDEMSEELLDIAAKAEIRAYKTVIERTLERGWADWRKNLYLFLVFTAPLTNLELDRAFIKKVQRLRIKELGERENELVLNQMRQCLSEDCDTEKAEKNLLARFKKIELDCINLT